MISKKNHSRRRKTSREMSAAEFEALAAPFDEEFIADKTRQPSAAERKLWQKAKRKMGRPPIGQGAKVISVSVEKGLLKQADRLAKRMRVSRAKLVSQGLRSMIKTNTA